VGLLILYDLKVPLPDRGVESSIGEIIDRIIIDMIVEGNFEMLSRQCILKNIESCMKYKEKTKMER
jgi:hypothetical protein